MMSALAVPDRYRVSPRTPIDLTTIVRVTGRPPALLLSYAFGVTVYPWALGSVKVCRAGTPLPLPGVGRIVVGVVPSPQSMTYVKPAARSIGASVALAVKVTSTPAMPRGATGSRSATGGRLVTMRF